MTRWDDWKVTKGGCEGAFSGKFWFVIREKTDAMGMLVRPRKALRRKGRCEERSGRPELRLCQSVGRRSDRASARSTRQIQQVQRQARYTWHYFRQYARERVIFPTAYSNYLVPHPSPHSGLSHSPPQPHHTTLHKAPRPHSSSDPSNPSPTYSPP